MTDRVADAAPSEKPPNIVRRLYDWVVHWAETPYGTPALAAISAAESSFFPVPPDPLLLALCLGARKKALRFAAVCTAASVVGGIIGYAIGAGAWHIAQDWFFNYVPGVNQHAFDRVQDLFEQYGLVFVFFAGLTPVPYKVFTLSSGVVGFSFPIFVLASILSRGLRFFLVAGLVWKFGAPMERVIDAHFNKLVTLFGILFVGGFLVIKYVL